MMRSQTIAARAHARGFTLVELMVGMVISSLFLVGSSMFVGNLVRETGRSEARQRAKDDATSALNFFERDVFASGTGMPMDALMIPEFNGINDDIQALTRHAIRDIEPGAGAADELWLGGSALQSGWTSAVISSVSGIDGATNNLLIPRQDGPDITPGYTACESYIDPILGGPGQCSNLVTFVNLYGPGGWVYETPKVVNSIAISGVPDVLSIGYDTSGPLPSRVPGAGHTAVYYRGAHNSAGIVVNPQSIPLVRWHLVQAGGPGTPGTLRREYMFAPRNPAAATVPVNGFDVMSNVVDFQVDFLVFRCGPVGAPEGPRWVNHLIDRVTPTANGEFDLNGSGDYDTAADVTGTSQRYLALRERLMGVRVTLLLQTRSEASQSDQSFPSGIVSDLQLENHVNAAATLNPNLEYLTVQRMFDPINLRIKGQDTLLQTFPPVRETATDQATWNGTFCRGRT